MTSEHAKVQKQGWDRAALGKVAKIERKSIEASAIAGGTMYVGLENIEPGGTFTDVQAVANGDLASNKFCFNKSHILYGKLRPYLAKIARPNFGGVCSTDILPILPGPAIDRGYLAHLLQQPTMVDLASSRATGANLPRLSPKALGDFEVSFPALPQQRRIAAVLDQADALRAKRREALARLDEITQSIFLDMFGSDASAWSRTVLPEAYWFQEGPGVRKWQFKSHGVKLLNVGNIERDGTLNLAKTDKYLSGEEAYGKYKHFLADVGDLVIASSGISFDPDGLLRTRGAFLDEQHLPLCMNTSTIRFKSIDGVSDLYFLQAWLSSVDFRKQITQLVTGSAQQNFGPSHLASLKITLPSLALQRKFATRVKAVERLKASHRAHLAELDELFASLQQRAFRGEL